MVAKADDLQAAIDWLMAAIVCASCGASEVAHEITHDQLKTDCD
jgi:hypothetical protein